MPDNKDVALRITADGQQMSKVVDMLQQQINNLRQSASNIPIGGSAGGGAGSGASNPGGSHSAAGIAANSATNAPSNPGRGATNGAQMPRVTQTAAGSAATPAALSTMPAPSRSGGGRTVGNGATQTGGGQVSGAAASMASIRWAGRAERASMQTGEDVDASDRPGVVQAEQNISTGNLGGRMLRNQYSRMNRARRVGLGADVDEPELLQAEYDAGGVRMDSAAARVQEREFSSQLSAARRRANMAGLGPATSLRTRRVTNDPTDQFDDDGQPRSPLNQALNRFAHSGIGRYARSAGYGLMGAVGRSTGAYFHEIAQEELTGVRNDSAPMALMGQTVGSVGGALIGGAFGGWGGILGAGVGGQAGSQIGGFFSAGMVGTANRAIGNQGLYSSMGYDPQAMEAMTRQMASPSAPRFQYKWAGDLYNQWRQGNGFDRWVADRVADANRALDPNTPYHADQAGTNQAIAAVATGYQQGGISMSLEDAGGLVGTDKRQQARMIARAKRIAGRPDSGFNDIDQMMTMGIGDYLSGFEPGEIDDDRRNQLITSGASLRAGNYAIKRNQTLFGTGKARIGNFLAGGGSALGGSMDSLATDAQSSLIDKRTAILRQMHTLEALGDEGTSSQQYADAQAELGSSTSELYGLRRDYADTRYKERASGAALETSRTGRVNALGRLTGDSGTILGQESGIRSAVASSLRAEMSKLSDMRRPGSGFTIAEQDAQEAHVTDIQSKQDAIGYDITSAWMGRFEMESGGRMSSIGLNRFMAQNYGSFNDIAAGVGASNAERGNLISGLRGRMGSMSSVDRIAAQQVIDQQQQGIEQDNIGLRDTLLSRNSDRIGLMMQPAQRAMAEAGRKGGVGAYRSAASGVLGVLGEEAGDIDSQIAMGGLTYDQATRLNRRRNEIRQEQDATSWEALTGGISRRNSIASNQVRGSGQAMLSSLGMAYGEYQQAGVAGDSPIFAELNTQRRAAQQTAYRQQDILSYNLPMAQMNAQEAIRQNMPFSPGYGLGMAMQRAGLRSGYINQRIGRYRSDMAHGDLSEEEQMGAASDILNLQVEQSRDIGMLARGGPGRIQAMSAGAPSYRGRFDSMSLASTALWRSGHPRMDMGFANGGHMAQAQGYFSQFRTDSFDPSSVMSPFSKGSGVQSETLQRAMLQALQSINNKIGGASGNPGGGMMAGEARQRADAALDVTRIDGRRNYGVRQ